MCVDSSRYRLPITLTAMIAAAVSLAGPGHCLFAADSWPQFRGPAGDGHAPADASVPLTFGSAETILWKQPIPGTGWSSPVIADGRIWMTTAQTTDATPDEIAEKIAADRRNKDKTIAGNVILSVVCVDAETGNLLTSRTLGVAEDPDPIHATNSFASPTPVVEGDRVFCHFGTYGTWCLDAANAETVWQQKISLEHGVGPGSSPVIHNGKLILVCDGMDQQFITALDTRTGKPLWQTPRPPMRATDGDRRKAYSTPLLIDVDGVPQAVIPGAQWICGYNPDSGEELWRIDHGSGFSTVPMPVYQSGLVIFATGFMRSELVGLDPTGRGDVTDTHVRWRMRRQAPTKPSPLAVGPHVYTISDNGIFCCTEIASGDVLYQERVPGKYSASPLFAAGHIFVGNHEGVVSVIQPGPNFKLVAENQLEGQIMASPAVLGDDFILRTADYLYRLTGSE